MNGLLIVDKPAGMTSHDVVSRLRRITGESSIGHLGTLDPMATGVLPMLLGKYTRLAKYFAMADKTYTGTIRFGFATDTYDAEGQRVGPVTEPQLSLDQVRAAAVPFHGVIEQMPPIYSAKKVGGKAAHKLAREGKPVELKPKAIHIHEFTIEKFEDDTAAFRITVSAGGYVRSVAHELGEALGCGGHLSSLRRTQAGDFNLARAHTLEGLGILSAERGDIASALEHPRTLLPEMPCVTADLVALGRMRNGGQINLSDYSEAEVVKVFVGQRELAGVAKRVAGTLFQPVIVML